MEKILIKGFRSNFKTYDRHEYFEIDADFNEIKFFFNKLLFESRAPEKKPEISKEEKKPERTREEKKVVKPSPANIPPSKTALEDLRGDQLETFNGVMSRKDIEESVRDFNKLIDCIVSGKTKSREDQKKDIVTHLDNIVSKKRSKDLAEKILKEGIAGVTIQMKIVKREIDALFK
jgi:calcineurin-like phosphoesterase family protein